MSDDVKKPQAESHTGGSGGHSSGGGGGHSKGPPHEDHDEGEHGGAPEWLISFADNTALIMGFFVIMLALNMAPKGSSSSSASQSSEAAKASGQSAEALDWAIGVREAFHNPVNINSQDPRDRILVMRLREQVQRGSARDPGIDGKYDESQSLRSQNYFGESAVVPFETNSFELGDGARETLAATARKLRGSQLLIDIRGHASAAEASTDPSYPSRLSFERALAVADQLVKQGMDRRQLRLIACGNSELLQHRAYKATDHHVNNRVEIVVTDKLVGP